ncbi:MAG TPA: hypothetical protein VN761_08900, partial [Candidatus Polarisedimenticolia bacterium]|nr:hypothetical protein [Candidatus Polarisedimenticolia bacterium]
IEAGSTSGWHTFEQSLLKAFEENLITEEAAQLYCVNRTQMRQRIDAAMKRRESTPAASTLKMKVTERPPAPRPAPAPTSALAFQEPLPEIKPRVPSSSPGLSPEIKPRMPAPSPSPDLKPKMPAPAPGSAPANQAPRPTPLPTMPKS